MGVTLKTTIEQKVVPELSPEQTARVEAILGTYHELKEQADLLYDAMAVENAKVHAIMHQAGYDKIEVGGVACTIVRGNHNKLNKVKFVELGGSLEQLANATETKPKKPYLLIGKEENKDA